MDKKKKGFTLIELLTVMTIIAVLAGLALVSYGGAQKSARDGKRKSDLEQIRSALEMCYADTNSYPAAIYPNVSCGTETYLSGTPRDPNESTYYYNRPTSTSYTLCAFLEVDPPNNCGVSGYNYRVTSP